MLLGSLSNTQLLSPPNTPTGPVALTKNSCSQASGSTKQNGNAALFLKTQSPRQPLGLLWL